MGGRAFHAIYDDAHLIYTTRKTLCISHNVYTFYGYWNNAAKQQRTNTVFASLGKQNPHTQRCEILYKYKISVIYIALR